ncbi:MAG: hypothetical protein RLZZ253_2278 [Verrucomicrobiota bacterium]|jgi:hypothetical protein
MNKAYPKPPQSIDVLVVTQTDDSDLAVGHKEKSRTNLLDLLDKWLLHMGYSSAYIKGVVCQLLTSGKIQVVFKNHTERFELADYADVITSPQAMKLLEDYVSNHRGADAGPVASRALATHRIVFQPPKP